MFELLEPICLVTYFADECNQELAALGHRTYWDGYFASRAAPLGRGAGAGRARGLLQLRRRGGRAAHPERMGDDPARGICRRVGAGQRRLRTADPRRRAGRLPPPGARRGPDHQSHDERAYRRTGDVRRDAHPSGAERPGRPAVASATMLREHRGDGHVAALVGARIGGTEAHVLSALAQGIHPPESFGRIHHLPKERLAAVMDGLRERGLVDTDGRFTDAGRETKQRIEALTDELAAPPYDALSPAELDELVTELEPITATLVAAGSQ
ncbi:SCO6745 family protein [Streptomyces mirabilis]